MVYQILRMYINVVLLPLYISCYADGLHYFVVQFAFLMSDL